MATNLACALSTPIRASSGSFKKPDPNRIKPTSSSSWWTPLFGWSSTPDYINDSNAGDLSELKPEGSASDSDPSRFRSRYVLGCFTEQKAKQLRRKTMENASFHDMMYHSAIASRLASDFRVGPRSDGTQ